MGEQDYLVFIKHNGDNMVTAVNSSAFIDDTEGWIEIDSGYGDKYHHAQGNYFDKPLIDENGLYNYKFVDGKPVERTDEEKEPELVRIDELQEITDLKGKLAETDYIAAKIAEGAATAEEYKDEIAQRQKWRERINELEKEGV